MEQDLELEKEVIYAAAVLHDIGKYAQYEDGTPHEQSGEKVASEILDSLPDDAAFFEEEKRMILTAIRGHRKLRADAEPLNGCSIQAIRRHGCALPVRQRMNVTGARIRKIWN